MSHSPAILRLARFLKAVLTAGLIALPTGIILYAMMLSFEDGPIRETYGSLIAVEELAPWQRWSFVVVSLLPFLPLAWVLISLRRLTAHYARGQTLEPGCARLILNAGWGLLAAAGVNMLTKPSIALILSAQNPPGLRAISIGIGSSDLQYLLSGAAMILIGWVMVEATQVAEDHRQIL